MINIAVFEDNPLVLKSITTTIKWNELGCNIVGTAENGNDAYTLLQEMKVDIVISDIKMPGIDGLSLVKKMSEMGLHTKTILITGFHEFELAKQAVHLGVFEMLVKPVSNDSIRESVNRAIDAFRKEKIDLPDMLPFRAPDDASSLVRHVIAFINKYYAADITLESAAVHLKISSNHLSRILKKETGFGFVEILTKKRLTEALKLLEHPDAKVYTIAEQVGYKNYAYFYQVFKKIYGISPQKYRNKNL